MLTQIADRDGTWAAVPIPFWVRLPIAVALVAWGARTDRRWTVAVAAMVSLPALWYGGLSMLLGVLPLRDCDDRDDQSAESTAEGVRRPTSAEPVAAGA